MAEQSPSQGSPDPQEHLEPPQKSVELEDAGAQDSGMSPYSLEEGREKEEKKKGDAY